MNWAIELSRIHVPDIERANLYGVILYTDRHVHVKKMLKDADYWAALDEISGPKWLVFATQAAQGHSDLPRSSSPLVMNMMVPVWKEPRANAELLEAFEIRSTEGLPALVIFAEGTDGTLRKKVLEFDSSSEEAAFDSLRKVLKAVDGALGNMYPEFLRHETRAHEVAERAVVPIEQWETLKKGLAFLQWIKSLVKW